MSNGPVQNALLAQAEQRIESQLTPDNRANYLKIVVAGMRAGLAGGPNSLLAKLKQSKDPVHDCAIGAVNLALVLRKQAHGVMPLKAMVPAATTLMIKALDFAENAGLVKVDAPTLAKATRLLTNDLFQAFHITPQMMAHAAAKVHAMTRDPGNMEAIKRAAGAVKDPRASEPTPMPEGEE
jgi:hypothetical protein